MGDGVEYWVAQSSLGWPTAVRIVYSCLIVKYVGDPRRRSDAGCCQGGRQHKSRSNGTRLQRIDYECQCLPNLRSNGCKLNDGEAAAGEWGVVAVYNGATG